MRAVLAMQLLAFDIVYHHYFVTIMFDVFAFGFFIAQREAFINLFVF
jgi:hypothetical protein